MWMAAGDFAELFSFILKNKKGTRWKSKYLFILLASVYITPVITYRPLNGELLRLVVQTITNSQT
jgi:hypothetical protein